MVRIFSILGWAYITIFLMLVAYFTFGFPLGYDIWFHLKNGEAILSNLSIHHSDPFLFSTSMLPSYYFTNYEWLFGVITYKIFSGFQYWGINLFRTILITCTYAIVFATCLRKNVSNFGDKGEVVVCSLVVILAFLSSLERFEPRPQLLSGFFLASLIYLVNSRGKKVFVAVGAISLIWANCHIEYFLGVGFIVLTLIQRILRRFVADIPENQRHPGAFRVHPLGSPPEGVSTPSVGDIPDNRDLNDVKDDLGSISIMLAIMSVVLLSSPSFRGLISQGFEYYSREKFVQSFNFYNVELIPVDGKIIWEPYGVLLSLGIISMIVSGFYESKRRLEFVTFIGFGVLPFISNRFLFPASVMIASIVSDNVGFLLAFVKRRRPLTHEVLLVLATISVPFFIYQKSALWMRQFASPPSLRACADAEAYNPSSIFPDGALRFLNRRQIWGNLFCPEKWGNFVVFYDNPCAHLKDDAGNGIAMLRKPFINGMVQTYNLQLLEDYLKLFRVPSERSKILEKYAIDLIVMPYPEKIVEPEYAFIEYLENAPGWGLIYWDDVSMVFCRKDNPSIKGRDMIYNAVFPARFDLDDKSFSRLASQDVTLGELMKSRKLGLEVNVAKTDLWRGEIFRLQGRPSEAVRAYIDALKKNPLSSWTLYLIGMSMYDQGDIVQAINLFEKALLLNRKVPVLLYNLSVAYFKIDKITEGLALLDECLDLDSKFQPALNLKRKLGVER